MLVHTLHAEPLGVEETAFLMEEKIKLSTGDKQLVTLILGFLDFIFPYHLFVTLD